jgi:hypothetical protein
MFNLYLPSGHGEFETQQNLMNPQVFSSILILPLIML